MVVAPVRPREVPLGRRWEILTPLRLVCRFLAGLVFLGLKGQKMLGDWTSRWDENVHDWFRMITFFSWLSSLVALFLKKGILCYKTLKL